MHTMEMARQTARKMVEMFWIPLIADALCTSLEASYYHRQHDSDHLQSYCISEFLDQLREGSNTARSALAVLVLVQFDQVVGEVIEQAPETSQSESVQRS